MSIYAINASESSRQQSSKLNRENFYVSIGTSLAAMCPNGTRYQCGDGECVRGLLFFGLFAKRNNSTNLCVQFSYIIIVV